jgi:hypothetical protein
VLDDELPPPNDGSMSTALPPSPPLPPLLLPAMTPPSALDPAPETAAALPLKAFAVKGTLAETAALIGDELVVVVGVIWLAIATPDVPIDDAIKAPPVAVAVDVAVDVPPSAPEAEPLFEPAPPAPAVRFTVVLLVAELV